LYCHIIGVMNYPSTTFASCAVIPICTCLTFCLITATTDCCQSYCQNIHKATDTVMSSNWEAYMQILTVKKAKLIHFSLSALFCSQHRNGNFDNNNSKWFRLKKIPLVYCTKQGMLYCLHLVLWFVSITSLWCSLGIHYNKEYSCGIIVWIMCMQICVGIIWMALPLFPDTAKHLSKICVWAPSEPTVTFSIMHTRYPKCIAPLSLGTNCYQNCFTPPFVVS